MADFDGVINPPAGWPDIPDLSVTAVARGGPGGPMNAQALAVAARLNLLRQRVASVSDYSSLTAAIASVNRIYLSSDVLLPDDSITRIPSGITFYGPGKIKASVRAYLQIWGTLGPSVSYGTPISRRQRNFSIENTFAVDDLLLFSNYPTDATDAYTEGAPDIFGRKPRYYSDNSVNNKRQTRRKELAFVKNSGSTFSLYCGTTCSYPDTTGLQIRKVIPVTGVIFDGTVFENITIDAQYTVGFLAKDITLIASGINMKESVNGNIGVLTGNSRSTVWRVDCYEACQNINVTGSFRGIESDSDNGIVKINGCTHWQVDVYAEGSVGNAGEGVQVDTNFGENPSGYTDLPNKYGKIRTLGRDMHNGQLVQLTNDRYATELSHIQIDMLGDGCGLQLQGASFIEITGVIDFVDSSGNSAFISGCDNINFRGSMAGGIFESGYANPRNNAQVTTNSNISRLDGPFTIKNQPSFQAYLSSDQLNVTGEGTSYTIPFDAEVNDTGGVHSAGIFTAPIKGRYSFSWTVRASGIVAGNTEGWIALVTPTRTYYYQNNFAALRDTNNITGISGNELTWLNKGDSVRLQLRVNLNGTKNVGAHGSSLMETFWSGELRS